MPLANRIARTPTRRRVLERAQTTLEKHGGTGVFLSTWQFASLWPMGQLRGWRCRHGLAAISDLGYPWETIWVSAYVGLGRIFASQVSTVADVMGNVVGLLAALAVADAMGMWIRGALVNTGKKRAGKNAVS